MMRIPTFEAEMKQRFAAVGARVEVRPMLPTRWRSLEDMLPFAIDIRRDRRGQIYDLELNEKRVKRLLALDVRPRQRHLLLMLSEEDLADDGFVCTDHRLLCGHDEREWFVAALPRSKRASTVTQAMEALKPNLVVNSQRRHRVKTRNRNRRRNGGFVRQGEWFFVPDPRFEPRDKLWHRNEPLSREGGKPHIAEYLVRIGGRPGYTRGWGRVVITEGEFRSMMFGGRNGKPTDWVPTTIDPIVYVRGAVRHPDHKTVVLPTWHRVLANTEEAAGRNRRVRFID